MIHEISVADRSAAVTADLDHTAGHLLTAFLLITAGDRIQQLVAELHFTLVLFHISTS